MARAKSADRKAASLSALAAMVGKHGETLGIHAKALKDLRGEIASVRTEAQGYERKSKKGNAVFREELQLWMRDIDSKVGDIKRATDSANVLVAEAVKGLEDAAKRFDDAVLGIVAPRPQAIS